MVSCCTKLLPGRHSLSKSAHASSNLQLQTNNTNTPNAHSVCRHAACAVHIILHPFHKYGAHMCVMHSAPMAIACVCVAVCGRVTHSSSANAKPGLCSRPNDVIEPTTDCIQATVRSHQSPKPFGRRQVFAKAKIVNS